VRRRSRSGIPRGRPRSGRELAHTYFLLGKLLGDEGRTCLEAPLILAAALLAPAPLWRLATVIFPICLAAPLPASFRVLQSSPQLRLEPPPLTEVVLVEGALATRAWDLPTAIHGGAKDLKSGTRGSRAPEPLVNVKEGGWSGGSEM
jgi:hypothetical protein